ncbi:MAG: serpin family protein [Bacteroidales bacterium]|nr:serpin family protein [Bacteroidales bacterium]
MKKTFLYSSIICACAMMAFTSCNNSDEPNVENEKPAQYSIQLTAPQQKVLSQSNDFAFDVLKTINNEDGNVFVSPYSLGQAIGMLANGAEGQTYDEIAAVLKIGDGTSLDDINNYYADMNTALTSIKCSSQFAVANSLWTNKRHNILDIYKSDMKSHFGAKVESLDFSDSKSFALINDWVTEQTAGLIPSIVDKCSVGADAAMLINSVYFKGLWSYFKKEKTHDDIFRNQFDRNEKVKMMKSAEALFNGCTTDDELAVEFDYGGKAFQLMVIMPKKQKINEYIASFNGAKYTELLSYMKQSRAVASLPKFKQTYNNNLKAPLEKMGILRAFGDAAQFPKISEHDGLCVTDVLQKTTIEVNEEGSVAAAVTRVDYGDTSPGFLPKEFTIDHPFIYLIKERTTGAILFIGKVQSMAGMQ